MNKHNVQSDNGVPVTLQQELARCVRFLNFCGVFSTEAILADPAVSRILADLAAASLPEAKAA